jgi:hypothetical protein
MAEYTKKDDTTLTVAKSETKEETNDYTLEFLQKQLLDITKQKNDFIEARNKEIDEVKTLIAEAEKLGIKTALEIEEAKTDPLEVKE